MCQGDDWKEVVEANTRSLLQFVQLEKSLFHKDLKEFKNLILLTGSLEDTMVRKDLMKEYQEMIKIIGHGDIHMFETGKHPSILS